MPEASSREKYLGAGCFSSRLEAEGSGGLMQVI